MSYGNQDEIGPETASHAGGVGASIWSCSETARTGQHFDREKSTLERVYKASDGSWKSTSSFDANDGPNAILVLSRAYAYMDQETGAPSPPGMREEFVHDDYPRP